MDHSIKLTEKAAQTEAVDLAIIETPLVPGQGDRTRKTAWKSLLVQGLFASIE
jgi:hypothetical protein